MFRWLWQRAVRADARRALKKERAELLAERERTIHESQLLIIDLRLARVERKLREI